MGPKINKGKKKKKEDKLPKMKKSEYLEKIAERNAVLAKARSKIREIEDVYYEAEKGYEKLKEDTADIIKYLEHEIKENKEEIAAFDVNISEYKNEINQNDIYYESIFVKMESDYEKRNIKLKNQLEMANAKLFASEEVRQHREEYLRKKDDLDRKLREMEERHQEEIYHAEKMTVIKQDSMQKEMETNVTTLATDFRQATDIAIGETTNKLIKDNIKLGNMLTCMQHMIEKVRESYQKVRAEEKTYILNADLLSEEQSLVMQKYAKHLNNIETILKSHEEISERISVSQRLFKDNRRLKRQITEKECILKDKVKEVEGLVKILEENTDASTFVKNNFNNIRNKVVKQEYLVYEMAKRAKEGINIEQYARREDDKDDIAEIDKDEQEENYKELKYKMREMTIEDIIEKISKGLRPDHSDVQIALSTDSNLASMHGSALSDLGLDRSFDVHAAHS